MLPLRLGSILATLCFTAVTCVSVLVADTTLATAVERGLTAMVFTFAIGWVVGWMAERVVRERVDAQNKTMAAERAEKVRKLTEKAREMQAAHEEKKAKLAEEAEANGPARKPMRLAS